MPPTTQLAFSKVLGLDVCRLVDSFRTLRRSTCPRRSQGTNVVLATQLAFVGVLSLDVCSLLAALRNEGRFRRAECRMALQLAQCRWIALFKKRKAFLLADVVLPRFLCQGFLYSVVVDGVANPLFPGVDDIDGSQQWIHAFHAEALLRWFRHYYHT